MSRLASESEFLIASKCRRSGSILALFECHDRLLIFNNRATGSDATDITHFDTENCRCVSGEASYAVQCWKEQSSESTPDPHRVIQKITDGSFEIADLSQELLEWERIYNTVRFTKR